MKTNNRYLVIDFETKDPFIGEGYGSGWVFNLNHDKDEFKLLGAAVYDSLSDKTLYYTDTEELKTKLTECKTWVFFNAQYDVGCILVLFKGDPSFNLDEYHLIDTQTMTKLHCQDMMRYSLDEACKRFDLVHQKDKGIIGDYAWESGLYQIHKQKETKRQVHKRPADNLLNRWAITNLDLLPDSVVGKYCIQDVDATNNLYMYLNTMVEYDEEMFSDLIKACLAIRQHGVRVDLAKAKEVSKELLLTETALVDDINKEFGLDLNINSPYQLGDFLETIGIGDYPRTAMGNPSVSTEYLESIDNEWTNKLAEARLSHKIRCSFVDKIINYQGFDNNIDGDTGIMYLSHHILGATQTGRFTSGGGGKKGFELNIQQIPSAKKHKRLGHLCRSMFLPDENETWVSADFSSQESRIQVHYAFQLNCEGSAEIMTAWNEDHNLDFHSKVAEITGLPRQNAKMINFGLSFGMGPTKLCESLGLPTTTMRLSNGKVIPVAGPEGKKVLDQYHALLPFMKEVSDKSNKFLGRNGYITTLGKRKLKLNPYFKFDDRKGFSKLIQGSAADMTMKALVAAHRKGLKILNTVHDEINITSSDPEKDSKILKECMETAYELNVPMVAEVTFGKTWGDQDE